MLTIPHTGGFGVDTVKIPGPFKTLADIRRANSRAGKTYFGRGETRFFNSRPLRSVYGGRIFIDSTQFVASNGFKAPRKYQPVLVLDNGETEHIAIPPRDWNGSPRTNGKEEYGWGDAEFFSIENARIFVKMLLRGDYSPRGSK